MDVIQRESQLEDWGHKHSGRRLDLGMTVRQAAWNDIYWKERRAA